MLLLDKVFRYSPYVALAICVVGAVIGSGEMVRVGGGYIIGYKSRDAFGPGFSGMVIAMWMLMVVLVLTW